MSYLDCVGVIVSPIRRAVVRVPGARMIGNRSMRRPEPPAIRSTEEVEVEHHGAWQEWLRSMTPDELVALEEAGLIAPKLPRKTKRARRDEGEDEPNVGTCDHLCADDVINGQRQLDPAEALMAREEVPALPGAASLYVNQPISEETKDDLRMLGYVLAVVVDAENPRLEVSLIALALGIGARQGITLAGLRTKHDKGLRWLRDQVEEWRREFDLASESLRLLKRVVSPILASRNPRLEAECIAMAARFGLSEGASMTARGEFHGVCKAAVSARVGWWVEEFGLVLPRECKQQTANYKLYNVRREKPKAITL